MGSCTIYSCLSSVRDHFQCEGLSPFVLNLTPLIVYLTHIYPCVP